MLAAFGAAAESHSIPAPPAGQKPLLRFSEGGVNLLYRAPFGRCAAPRPMPAGLGASSGAEPRQLASERREHLFQLLVGRQREIDEQPLLAADFTAAAALARERIE